MRWLIFILVFVVSCTDDNKASEIEQEESFETFKDSLFNIGFKSIPNANFSLDGPTDSLMIGWRNLKNGPSIKEEVTFKSLQINKKSFYGLVGNGTFSTNVMYYEFNFKDIKEEEKFIEFQPCILYYHHHHKEYLRFFKIDDIWYGEHWLNMP